MGLRVPRPVARPCLERPTRPDRPLRPDLRARRLRRRHRRAARRRADATRPSQRAIVALENLEHRGAAGADPNTGDGAGILLQIPDEFLRGVVGDGPAAARRLRRLRLLPARRTTSAAPSSRQLLEETVEAEGQRVVGWRDVPVDKDYVGITANLLRALHQAARRGRRRTSWPTDQDAFERKLYVIRRVAEMAAGPDLVDPELQQPHDRLQGHAHARRSCSATTPTCRTRGRKSALALVHSRFSTNTFPSWELAHPYRMIAHNGEINTLRGNVNWMRARESQLASELFGDDLAEGAAGRAPGRLGLGDVRQRARAARARRPHRCRTR